MNFKVCRSTGTHYAADCDCMQPGDATRKSWAQTTWLDSHREPEHNGPSPGYSNDLIVVARVLHAKSACALNTAGRFDLTNSETFDALVSKFVGFVMSSGSYRFFGICRCLWRVESVVVCFCLYTCLCAGKRFTRNPRIKAFWNSYG